MGLKEIIQAAAATGMKALGNGDVLKAVTWRQTGTVTYDPETGTPTTPVTDYPVFGLLYDYSVGEIGLSGGVIQVGDQKLVLAGKDLGFTPQEKDGVIIAGDRWNVIRTQPDPVGATWTIQLRRA